MVSSQLENQRGKLDKKNGIYGIFDFLKLLFYCLILSEILSTCIFVTNKNNHWYKVTFKTIIIRTTDLSKHKNTKQSHNLFSIQ